MSEIVIKAENLGKSYIIGHQAERGGYVALRDVLVQNIRGLFRKTRDLVQGKSIILGDTLEEVWAIKDMSFDIHRGEAVGIIGRNGAGKSTLLKILSRITEPSAGRATIKGRVASLLEVGTGVHPELTGRENIYLNGAILGMTRVEIKRKFDEIVAFAEVEKFLDTPVKRYSSGMYVRLAFAVAAHLEPEILVVDEVLAVGDATFQKKCLGKMGDVAKGGRTVLFVSHNMAAVEQLCQKTMIIQGGKLTFFGDTQEAVRMHLSAGVELSSVELSKRSDRKGNRALLFTGVAIYDDHGNELRRVISGQNIRLRCYYVADSLIRDAKVNASICIVEHGRIIINLNSENTGDSVMDIHAEGFFECRWDSFCLTAGIYNCILFCSINGEIADWIDPAFVLDIDNGDFFEGGGSNYYGVVLIKHRWSSNQISPKLLLH